MQTVCSEVDDGYLLSGMAWEGAGTPAGDAGIGDGLSSTFWQDYDNFPSSEGTVKVSDYANTLYLRGAWADFNPEEGKYAWNSDCDTPSAKRLKMLIEGAKQRNMKLAFTFVVDSRDKHYNFTPNFVKEAGAKGYETQTGSVKVWSPYPDDPIFQNIHIPTPAHCISCFFIVENL